MKILILMITLLPYLINKQNYIDEIIKQGDMIVIDDDLLERNMIKLDKAKNIIKYMDIIDNISEEMDIDRELIIAQIMIESSGKNISKSNMGAQGLMQLMPKTAKYLGCDNVLDPEKNIKAGVKYIKSHLNKYKDLKLALAAYNAGPGNVSKYNGIPPFKETTMYIDSVEYYYNFLKNIKV